MIIIFSSLWNVWPNFISEFDPLTLNTIVLSLTLLIIIRYAIFTYNLLKETRHQTSLSISPVIVIKIDPIHQEIHIDNVGNGAALNIAISSISQYIPLYDSFYELKFNRIEYLEVGKNKKLSFDIYDKTKKISREARAMFFDYIFRMGAKIIIINYRNLLCEPYYTLARLDKRIGYTRITSVSKRKLSRIFVITCLSHICNFIKRMHFLSYQILRTFFPPKNRLILNKINVSVYQDPSLESTVVHTFESRDEPIFFHTKIKKGGKIFYLIQHIISNKYGEVKPVLGYINSENVEKLIQ